MPLCERQLSGRRVASGLGAGWRPIGIGVIHDEVLIRQRWVSSVCAEILVGRAVIQGQSGAVEDASGRAPGPFDCGPAGQLPFTTTLIGTVKPSTKLASHQSSGPNAPPPEGFVKQVPEPAMQPKLPSNFESTGGAQPITPGHVNPSVAGPPLAPIWQFCPLLSHPNPGQTRRPASPVSGILYVTEVPTPLSSTKFVAFRVPPPFPRRY